MKYVVDTAITGIVGRAPQGARGLKFACSVVLLAMPAVAPRKGRVG